jgi:hypothetical protein
MGFAAQYKEEGIVIGWGIMLQADEVIGFFNWPNPSSRTTTQPLKEMSTRNLPGGKWRSVRGADNLTAIFEPIV